jgi:hypothetical protein
MADFCLESREMRLFQGIKFLSDHGEFEPRKLTSSTPSRHSGQACEGSSRRV